jgi:hypothetical protein
MSGGDFEKWRRGWEQEQAWKAAWEKKHAPEGSSSGGAPRAADEEEEAKEGEDPLFLESVAASKKDAADKARAEAEEATQAIAAVNELMAREAAATSRIAQCRSRDPVGSRNFVYPLSMINEELSMNFPGVCFF